MVLFWRLIMRIIPVISMQYSRFLPEKLSISIGFGDLDMVFEKFSIITYMIFGKTYPNY
jgi:hypothetical protein